MYVLNINMITFQKNNSEIKLANEKRIPGKQRVRFSTAEVMFFCTLRHLIKSSPMVNNGVQDVCNSTPNRSIPF